MPPLENPRWEQFAQELAKGKSQTEAYLASGYKGDKSPATAASRLLTNVKVAARLRELQEVTAAKAEVTRESILAELEEARLMAKDNGHPAAAVSASMGKAKLVGLVVDRKEVGAPGEFADIENMTADELREHFAALVRSLEAEAGFGDPADFAEGAGKGPPRGKPH
jgi:Terminase small subunit